MLRTVTIYVKPLAAEDLPYLTGTGYAFMSEKTKLKMLADSQAKQYANGNYFEMFSLRDGTDVIGFVSMYSKEPGSVSIGLDIREQYRRQGYGTRSADPIAKLLIGKGFASIRNAVRTDNEASIRLHKKLGFTLTDRYTTEKGNEIFVFEKSVSAINVKPMLQNSVDAMVKAVVGILSENAPSVYLYGSVALDDFRLGWSDIDILVLTEKQITSEQAQRLVHLRREMTERDPQNPYYRLFEGGMLRLSAFLTDTPGTVVYWGTSGERVTARYMLNSLSKTELLENGILLYGKDVRGLIRRPAYEDLREDVLRHYETIRDHGAETGKSLYSFGWLLDISRGIYTLRTGKIIPKTKAGEWARQNALCPDPAALSAALHVRKVPAVFAQDKALQSYVAEIGVAVQAYADVLQAELERHAHKVFGARENGVNYYDRPGAYLIAERNGKIAVVQTKRGFFLPGGGLENGESDEACICREVLEETGCTAQVGAFLCSAECYTVHEKNGPFHPIQSYYAGRIGERISDPKEADHRFVWLPAQDVRGRFYPEMQNWALEMYLNEKEQRGFCYE